MSRSCVAIIFLSLLGCGRQTATPVAPPADHSLHGGQTATPGGHADHGAPSKDGPGAQGGHEAMNMPTQRKLVVGTDPSEPQAGSATKLVLQIQDDDGTPIKAFELLHEKLAHLIVVREGLDEFAHLHPDVDASGMITGEFTFPKSGKYRLFIDHQPQGKSPGLAVGELAVAGDDEPAAALVPNASHEVTVGEIKAHVAIKPGDQETAVRFHIVDADNKAIGDLQPYLGAMGHLVIISADGREYVHAHPLSEAKTAPEGAVEFAAHFPKPGIYKAWGQFQRNGSVFTAPFVLEHKGGSATAGGHEHGPGGHGMMRGPGMRMGMGPGMMNGSDMAAMRQDAMGLHALLDKRNEIERQVRDMSNGVETVTESDDPTVAKQIREHVAAMYKRLEKNEPLPMMAHDPLFVEVFKHAKQIRLKLEDTPKGLKVIETSDDPYVAKLIQAHARIVDAFIANGMDEVHREHAVPNRESAVGAAQ